MAATFDGRNIILYVNGEEVANRRASFQIATNANNVQIGESPGFPGRVFDGKIDEVRIWNIARTAEEIKNSMNTNLGSTILGSETSGLVGYWSMDEGEGQTLNDLSFFKNDAVLGSSSSEDSSDPTWVGSEVEILVGVSEHKKSMNIPTELNLEQNYPNPFNPATKITFSIPESGNVKLRVYDVNGSLVEVLENKEMQKGHYTNIWDAANLSSGMYFINLSSGSFTKTIKAILLK